MILGFINQVFPNSFWGWASTIFSSLAIIIFIFSSSLQNKKKILLVQVLGHVLLGISEFISNAFSSIIQELISISRNILVYFNKNTKIVNIILIAIGVIFGTYCALFGKNTFTPWKGLDEIHWYSFLPIIANLEYSVAVMIDGISVKWLKLSFAISSFMWAISFMMQGAGLFISGCLNSLNGCAALLSFFMILYKEHKEKTN
mgnify:FL=1